MYKKLYKGEFLVFILSFLLILFIAAKYYANQFDEEKQNKYCEMMEKNKTNNLIGKKYTKTLENELKRFSNKIEIRKIEKNNPVTMDHKLGRLNIQLDNNDNITDIWCG